MRNKQEQDKGTDNVLKNIFGFRNIIITMFVLVFIIGNVNAINYTNNVVLGFNFSNNSATQYDITGHGYQGNISGTYVINSTNCFKDSCIYLGGSNNGIMRINTPSSNLQSNNFGISVWVKLSAIENLDTLLHTSALSNSVPIYNIEGDGASRFTIINGTAYTNIITTTLNNNTWIHLFFSLNGDNSSVYVNGDLVSTTTTGKFYTSGMFKELDFFNNRNAPSRAVNGWIDEFYIFNSSLSPDVVSYIYENNLTYPFVIPDNIALKSKNPADIDTSNAINGINLTYTYNYPNKNLSTIILNYTLVNSSNHTIYSYINGTQQPAYNYVNYTSNDTDDFLFILDDSIYPATYNMNHLLMSNSDHYNYSLTNAVQGLKTEILNVSAKEYDILEVNILSSIGTSFARIYYCNSSYTTGKVSTSPYCSLISLSNTTTCGHSHIKSCHNTYPMKITNGLFNNIIITSKSYFVIMGSNLGTINIGYVNQSIRNGLAQTTINDGVSYTSQTFTTDLHLHYYNTNDSIIYIAEGYNTSGSFFNSSSERDYFNLTRYPPSPVVSYTTKNFYGYNETIQVIRNNASVFDGGYIAGYDFNLYKIDNLTSSYYSLQNTNISVLNVSAFNLSNDYYIFEITATDNYSMESYSLSNVFYVGGLYNGTCNDTITLNTTGVNVYFDAVHNEDEESIFYLLEKNNITYLNTSGGIISFNTSSLFNGDYNILLSEKYDYYTGCELSFCRNDWERTTEPCVNNLKLINYTDINSCSEQYDIPTDINTYEDCVLPKNTDKDLWFIIILLVIWLFFIILSHIYTPFLIIINWLLGILLLFEIQTYFSDLLLGIIINVANILFTITAIVMAKTRR